MKRRGPFLVIGCGSIGGRHTRNLMRLGVHEVLVFDSDDDRRGKLADATGASPMATLEEAYRRHPVAALVCTPTSLHLASAREALEHGCHLFIEKPISNTLEGVRELFAEAAVRQKVLAVGYNLRFDPLLHALRRVIQEKRVGRVISVRLHFGSYLPVRHPWEDYRIGYGARKALGGGVILDAVHEIDYAMWLFGDPQDVQCNSGSFGGLEIDVEDTAEILLRYPSHAVSIHLNFVQRPHQRWAVFLCADGEVAIDWVQRTLTLTDARATVIDRYSPPITADDVYAVELEDFVAKIDAGGGDADSLAAKSLAVALAAKQSSQLRCAVRADYSAFERIGE